MMNTVGVEPRENACGHPGFPLMNNASTVIQGGDWGHYVGCSCQELAAMSHACLTGRRISRHILCAYACQRMALELHKVRINSQGLHVSLRRYQQRAASYFHKIPLAVPHSSHHTVYSQGEGRLGEHSEIPDPRSRVFD